MNEHPYLIFLAIAFFINIPLGYIREASPKFSLQRFLGILASVPFLMYFEIKFLVPAWCIPVSLFFAAAGQLLGGQLRRRQFTEKDIEDMEQIPDLKIPVNTEGIDDGDIMVVLLNMGGPKNISEVRGFLKRIFCDELIIRFPLSSLLQPVFANLLVALRGKATERRYGLIGGGSPILKSTTDQTLALQNEMNKRGRNLNVIFSFNYSNPLPDETITQIKSAHKKYILPLSLYPHYSAATTGSNTYYLKKAARRLYPDLTFLTTQSYYLADSYIEAFVNRIRETLTSGESLDDFYLLFSAHGLPLYFLAQGDSYPFQIAQTVAKILDRVGRKQAWAISYQSAVGPMRWLQPSTEAMIKALARRGIKKLLVVPVSFVTDHIETLCEIDIEYRAFAESLDISDFRMSKALECHPGFITALADCVEESLVSKSGVSRLNDKDARLA